MLLKMRTAIGQKTTDKLGNGRFSLGTRRNFMTTRMVKYWNKLVGEVVESSSFEIFKT